MLVMPFWMLKYALVIGGICGFVEEGEFYMLIMVIVGLVWCIYNWKNHRK